MPKPKDRALRIIAYFKLIKGTVLFILAIGILHMLGRDVEEMLKHWLNLLRVDPENKHAVSLLAQAGLLNNRKIEIASALTFVYSAMFLTEGIGLFMEKRWAEWFSVIATASFIPLEIYEVYRHVSAVKAILVIGNIAIVWFLIYRLCRPSKGH